MRLAGARPGLLATAAGALGSAADYLYRTCEGLRSCGLHDAALEALATRVRAWRQEPPAGPGAFSCAAS